MRVDEIHAFLFDKAPQRARAGKRAASGKINLEMGNAGRLQFRLELPAAGGDEQAVAAGLQGAAEANHVALHAPVVEPGEHLQDG